jgi:tetratricopeptide (TPR) repeat protein
MRSLLAHLRLLAGLVLPMIFTTSARAADIPIQVISDWSLYNRAGWEFLNRGQYDKAEDRFRRAIEVVRPYTKEDQRLLARSYADLARVFYHQGRYADAEPLAKWALSVRESQMKNNLDAIFQSLYTLALIHIAQEHFNQAEPLLRRALEIQEQEIGPNHIQTAATIDELAGVCAEERKFREAELLYKRAIAIFERVNPDDNLDLAGCGERFAALLDRMDRPADAAKYREQAKRIRDTVEAKTGRSKDTRPRPNFKGFKKSEGPIPSSPTQGLPGSRIDAAM